MSSSKNGAGKLPDGWVQCKSKSNNGRTYYFNRKTGTSLWTQPKDDDDGSEVEHCKQRGPRDRIDDKNDEKLKKNLKRKSTGDEDESTKKKFMSEKVPEKRKLQPKKVVSKKDDKIKKTLQITLKKEPTKKPINSSPSKSAPKPSLCKPSPSKPSPSKPCPSKTPVKWSPCKTLPKPTSSTPANDRLSRLRAQLENDISTKTDDDEPSPSKIKRKSPKPSLETKTNSSSPLNDTKLYTNQSPSSDIVPIIPSPSQFLAANKIISSMKAQLPEKYCCKSKPKDTFAEIEQGICSQTAEYPFMKHPSTPPQFSEASKLVSAIKTRLSYKIPVKDIEIPKYVSANDRLMAFRKRLSSDEDPRQEILLKSIEMPRTDSCQSESCRTEHIELPKSVAMDVEDNEQVQTRSQKSTAHYTNTNDSIEVDTNVVLVVDTNIFIHELDVIKDVLNSHIKGYSEQPTLLVPWRVISELDRLKDNNNGSGALCKRARAAMDYLYKSLPENSRIKGQSLRDSNSHIYPCESPDDEILNCCLQQAERGKSVILLSNDKNLCNKAAINSVKCITLSELRPLLESHPQPTVDPDLYASVKHYESAMHQLLANILENEMRAKYNNLWQYVLFKAPPWQLSDVLQCLLKHWIAVFNEVFPRIEHIISDLLKSLESIQNKGPKSLNQSEVANFKELCLDVARKCQIIPEYMQLAKATVERLLKGATDPERRSKEEMAVIDAFESLWTVFSSYCAKLATALGIAHTVEDKMPGNEPLSALTDKWDMFSGQIHALTHVMSGFLENEDTLEEQTARLVAVFKHSLKSINMDSDVVEQDNMKMFCLNSRNMLQEAFEKFTTLTKLLNTCHARLNGT